MWKDFVLLITVVVIILLLTLIWHIRHLTSNKEIYSTIPFKRYLLSNEKNNIKSGDIIFTRSSVASFQEVIIPYIYKHAGIIIEFNDTLYIAETFSEKVTGRSHHKLLKHKGGVGLTPFLEWAKNLVGPIFILKLNKPLSPKQIDILHDTVIQHYGEPYPSITSLYFIFIMGLPIKTSLYCYSFVHLCLVNVKLLNEQTLTANELSKFITTIYKYELNDGYRYEKPRQLVYDFECNEEIF